MDAIVSFSSEQDWECLLFHEKLFLFWYRNNLTLSHSYKSHGCGLAPWLPGHSQLSMKPTLQALEGPGELASWCSCWVLCAIQYAPWRLLLRPWKGLGRSLHGIYHFMAFTEASSPGPGRAWRGGFMVFLFGALCYTICTMKAPPRALEGPAEDLLWHLSSLTY